MNPTGRPDASSLRETYNRSAATYRSVRPDYPAAVFDAVEAYAGLARSARVVEVGVGTGQATLALVSRGWHVVGLEPGSELAAIARRELAPFRNVEIRECTFEEAQLPDDSVDLLAAATSWHWVDPAVGVPKAARVLHRRGVAALWWNAHVPDTDDPRWAPIRAVYDDVAPELARLARLTPDRPDYDPSAELAVGGHFSGIEEHVFAFSVDYTAESFLALLGTYASHQHLDEQRRQRLFDRLTATIECELGGTVTKPYEAVLVLGRRAG